MAKSPSVLIALATTGLAAWLIPATALAVTSLTVNISQVYVAAPGESRTDPSQIAWVVYDAFLGASLNPALWEHSEGSVATGGPGLTLTPNSLSTLGHTNSGIRASLPIAFGNYFAFRVPFSVATATADPSSVADFNVDICGPQQQLQCVSIGWARANNIVPPSGGPALSGTFFHQDDDNAFSIAPTTVTSGQFAMTYVGGLITSYFDDGSGWQQLGNTFSPPITWVPIRFELDAGVTVLPVSTVPEPSSALLYCLGILTLVTARRAWLTPAASEA